LLTDIGITINGGHVGSYNMTTFQDNRQQAIRRTVIAFSSLFKDIPFLKYENGVELERIKVPIIYSNKEKYVKRLDGDPGEIDKKIQLTLPRIEYGLLSYQYDESRKLNLYNKNIGCNSLGNWYVNSPVPYNFNFELTLYTRNIEDANQILEYILPYFTPDYTVKVIMVPEAGVSNNVPVSLLNANMDEDSTGTFDSPVRSVFRTLNFVARSYIYPPARSVKPILQAETNIYVISAKKTFGLVSGNGVFTIGETVYQGETYDSATAKGTIEYFNTATVNAVSITVQGGTFRANGHIKNVFNTADYIITAEQSNLALSSVITPVPNTYPVVGTYDYNIVIHDYTQ